ncbi:MAG: P-loop NTPase [Gaiellaceae bacterium]
MTDSPARYVVAVGSGKGGVGKSTISLNLALALTERGAAVGLLDADFYGPDIPLMVNIKRTERLNRWGLWRAGGIHLEPVERFGLRLMSVGFLLAEEQALAWPGQMVEFVGRQLIRDVAWGDLDFLIVDLPPGTADVQQQLVGLLPLAGAIVVVSPQDAAHLDAKRVVELFRDEDVPILGGIENMSGLVCPHCGQEVTVFPAVREERSIWALGVEQIGRIALDPAVAEAGDRGRPLLVVQPSSPQAEAFRAIARTVVERLEGRPAA